MSLALLLVVFALTFALLAGVVLAVDHTRTRDRRDALERLARRGEGVAPQAEVNLLRRVQRLSQFGALERLLAGRATTQRLLSLLLRAGVTRPVGDLVLVMLVVAIAGGAVGWRVAGPLVALPLVVAGALLPVGALRWRASARERLHLAQLPEALDAIVNSLKAGYSFPAALEFAAGEVPAPLGTELSRVRDEQRLGVEARTALAALADRVGTADARMFVTAVLLQRETGGNLAELLANLATLVRERAQFRGRVAALTAESRMSAVVLGLMPAGVLGVLAVVNRPYVRPLVETTTGHALLLFAVVASVVGFLVMRRLSAVEL